MPRLKGNSSHGSNPMTWLSRTLSWMPHCCPQKQQWVLTRRSAGCSDSSSQPPGGTWDGWGPYCAASASGDRGGLATGFLLKTKLRRGNRFAFARGAQLLPVARRSGQRVVETQALQDG